MSNFGQSNLACEIKIPVNLIIVFHSRFTHKYLIPQKIFLLSYRKSRVHSFDISWFNMEVKKLFSAQLFLLQIFGFQLKYDGNWKGKIVGIYFSVIGLLLTFIFVNYFIATHVSNIHIVVDAIAPWTSIVNIMIRLGSFLILRKEFQHVIDSIIELTEQGKFGPGKLIKFSVTSSNITEKSFKVTKVLKMGRNSLIFLLLVTLTSALFYMYRSINVSFFKGKRGFPYPAE